MKIVLSSRADPERGGTDGLGPLGKSQVYVGSLEYMYLVRTPLESNWTHQVQLLLEGGQYDPL